MSALLSWLVGSTCSAGTSYQEQFDNLITNITKQLAGGRWEITMDRRSICLLRRDVQLLFDVSLPLGYSTEQKWKEFSVESDYVSRIAFDTELSQVEYHLLKATKAKMIANRLRGLDRQTKAYAKAKAEAENLLRLPDY